MIQYYKFVIFVPFTMFQRENQSVRRRFLMRRLNCRRHDSVFQHFTAEIEVGFDKVVRARHSSGGRAHPDKDSQATAYGRLAFVKLGGLHVDRIDFTAGLSS